MERSDRLRRSWERRSGMLRATKNFRRAEDKEKMRRGDQKVAPNGSTPRSANDRDSVDS